MDWGDWITDFRVSMIGNNDRCVWSCEFTEERILFRSLLHNHIVKNYPTCDYVFDLIQTPKSTRLTNHPPSNLKDSKSPLYVFSSWFLKGRKVLTSTIRWVTKGFDQDRPVWVDAVCKVVGLVVLITVHLKCNQVFRSWKDDSHNISNLKSERIEDL